MTLLCTVELGGRSLCSYLFLLSYSDTSALPRNVLEGGKCWNRQVTGCDLWLNGLGMLHVRRLTGWGVECVAQFFRSKRALIFTCSPQARTDHQVNIDTTVHAINVPADTSTIRLSRTARQRLGLKCYKLYSEMTPKKISCMKSQYIC